MSENKKHAIQSVNPFIKHIYNLSVLRKIGFSFFLKTSSRESSHIEMILSENENIFKSILKGSFHIPFFLAQVLVFLFCLIFILSIANSAPYLSYFFSFILLLSSIFTVLLIRMSLISSSGLALQFRIPENFDSLSILFERNNHRMSTSKSPNVRYSVQAFNDLTLGEPNPQKLISVINGVIEHFNIESFDLKNKNIKNDDIENIINESFSKEDI